MQKKDLCLTIEGGNSQLVAPILTDEPDAANEICANGKLPLTMAIESNNVDIVKLLLGHGANVEASETKDPYNPSAHGILSRAIVAAARFDEYKAIDLLLQGGLSINYRDPKSGMSLLARAILNSAPLTSYLLEHGADPNLTRHDGWTPLMIAAAIDLNSVSDEETIRIVEMLVQSGADVSAKNDAGETACDILDRQSTSASIINKIRYLLNQCRR